MLWLKSKHNRPKTNQLRRRQRPLRRPPIRRPPLKVKRLRRRHSKLREAAAVMVAAAVDAAARVAVAAAQAVDASVKAADSGGRGGGRDRDRDESGMESAVVRIYRCAKVVKGGRTFSFGALVVAGDRKGNVGIGYGKANEVPMAVEKATKDARKSLVKVTLKGTTIPHQVKGTSGASTVILVPARPGTGVTAGKSVRPCVELAGITDILTKAYGSTSPKNLVKATMAALAQLQNRDQVENNRGVKLEKGAGELVTA